MFNSRICSMLSIRYPIIQGAMAWIADAELAAAVSNAGGLGIIAAGNAPAHTVRQEIMKAKKLTDKPFGVNIMLLSPYADEVAALVCETGVKVVTTGAGNPGKYMQQFKENNIVVIPVVPSVAMAKRMERTGADALVAEGMESGGHIGKTTTMALVPQVADAVQIPVIAAGGVADGRGLGAALMLGGDAVQIGTRFLVAKECNVHQRYKEAILSAKDIDTTITGNITGHPVRVLRNRLAREYLELEKQEMRKEQPDMDKFDALGKGALRRAVVDGDIEHGSVMSGQIAGLVQKEQTCLEIIEELMAECRNELEKLNQRASVAPVQH